MFTGIIECLGKIESVAQEGTNKVFQIKSPISQELKIDQSVAHNGVCLTITKIENGCHWVTAIDETLLKTSLNTWKPNDEINLERCLKLGDRLDGHWVQGHVDTTGICTKITDENGSWKYEIEFANTQNYRTVAKGSITLNGTSLTVVDSELGKFSVAIIPYTYEHTSIKHLKVGDPVNLEFDIIGKWVKEWMK
jgi:riboflavin synthase